jgi:L,D-peptidoglycan transpeptidase YkuD (ErfK/YbiS/YcfS/YnhG family)
MDLIVKSLNLAEWDGRQFTCAVGRNGFVSPEEKREGDGKTPIGRWVMREVFYRPDKGTKPETSLPVREIRADDAWCEDPYNKNYNRFVKYPHPESDRLWRDDHLYDIVAVLGYNDDPVVSGKGSAIFFHIARPGFVGTGGCVAMAREDLLTVLREAKSGSAVLVNPHL